MRISDVSSDVCSSALVAIAFAAGFIDGLGQAVSQAGTTTTQRSDGSYTSSRPALNTNEKLAVAAGTAASTTGQLLMQEFGSRPTTVIVRSCTPVGVLFLQTERATQEDRGTKISSRIPRSDVVWAQPQ